jgi:ABC-type dipeptide/oligopeptide/nickel transport system permease component
MKTLLLRRLGVSLPTLLLVSMMVFGLQKLLPGDPALALAGEERNPEVVEYLRQKYRFNDPIPVQYVAWLKALVQGDFGTSVRTRLPIGTMLVEKLPVTIELAILSMLVALLLGLPIGILAALRRGTPFDYGASVFGLVGLSVPHFWLGIMLICFALRKRGAQPAFNADARSGTRHRHRRHHDAPCPQRDDPGDEAGLCAHRPRERCPRSYHRAAPCAAERADPGGDTGHVAVRRIAGRRGADRAGFFHTWLW